MSTFNVKAILGEKHIMYTQDMDGYTREYFEDLLKEDDGGIKTLIKLHGVHDDDVNEVAQLIINGLKAHKSFETRPTDQQQAIETTCVTTPPTEPDVVSKATPCSKDIMAVVKQVRRDTAAMAGKDVVCFIGVTGAGKTTYIQYLLDEPLDIQTHTTVSDGRTTAFRVIDGNHSSTHVISHVTSGTKTPMMACCEAVNGATLYLVDLPGDMDTAYDFLTTLRNSLF
eukprot:PhF_6_TR33063/c0_g1_i3/m.48706